MSLHKICFYTIEEILINISYFKVEKYITYLIVNKKEFILKLYNYLISLKNTLDNKKLSIYSNLSKALLKYGNLKNDKYEKLFLLYVKYSYDYIKNIYNQDLSDEELLNILETIENIMITELISTLSGKYDCSVGKEKLIGKFNIIKNGILK